MTKFWGYLLRDTSCEAIPGNSSKFNHGEFDYTSAHLSFAVRVWPKIHVDTYHSQNLMVTPTFRWISLILVLKWGFICLELDKLDFYYTSVCFCFDFVPKYLEAQKFELPCLSKKVCKILEVSHSRGYYLVIIWL